MKKKLALDTCFRVLVVVTSSVIYSIGLIWFLEPAHLYAGGLSGLAQLISRGVSIISGGKFTLNIGILIFALNFPVLFIGVKYVSRKFAIYSFISIVVQSICTSGLIPVVDFKIDVLSMAIIGGLITGFGGAVALRYGTSTGGIDVVAQALAFKKNMSIGTFTLIFNIFIAVCGGGILQGDWTITLYTFIRIILTAVVTDKIHTTYNYLEVNIITTHGTEIATQLMSELARGCTVIKAEGAYSHSQKDDLYTVVSYYEVERVSEIARTYDPHSFIVVSPVKRLLGNFKRKTII